jgi:hypothetical protein
VCLPKLLLWYAADFGSTLLEVLHSVASMLGDEGEQLRFLLSDSASLRIAEDGEVRVDTSTRGSYRVVYNAYDWTPNAIE